MSKKQLAIYTCGAIVALLLLTIFILNSCSSCSSKTQENVADEVSNSAADVDFSEIKETESNKGVELESSIKSTLEDVLGSEDDAFAGVSVWGLDQVFQVNYNSVKMESASIIKLFVATSVYENIGTVIKDGYSRQEVDDTVYLMISQSDNYASDECISMLGGGDLISGFSTVNKFCFDYGFENTSLNHAFTGGPHLEVNYTSAYDCAKLLEMIYNNEIAGSEQILEAMGVQERTTKIPAGITDDSKVYNKTGEYDGVQQDVAIIEGKHTYILCITCVNDSDYESVAAITEIANRVNTIIQSS